MDKNVTAGIEPPHNPKVGDIWVDTRAPEECDDVKAYSVFLNDKLIGTFDASSEAAMFSPPTQAQLNAANVRIGEQSEIIIELEGRLEDAITRSYLWATATGALGLLLGYGLSYVG